MKFAVFSKKRQTIDAESGKARDFYTFLTTLINKTTGEPLTVQVKFREACGAPDPKKCPCFIEVDREKMNLSWEKYLNEETGEQLEAGKLWVTEWSYGGEYVDHSMDDFDALGV